MHQSENHRAHLTGRPDLVRGDETAVKHADSLATKTAKAATCRIGLFGNFAVGNFGNDGSLEAMLNFLRAVMPDAEIVCICPNPAKASADFGVRSIEIMERSTNRVARLFDGVGVTRWLLHLSRIIRKVSRLDVIIMPGTGLLDDFGDTPWGMPAKLFCWCLAARVCRTRIAFVSIGAGPVVNRRSRWLTKWVGRMAHFRSYRDAVSKEFMQSIGVDTRRDVISPDIAFGLPSPTLFPSEEQKPAIVGLGVMTYYGWRYDRSRDAHIYEQYLAKMIQFAKWLMDRGYRVRLLIGDDDDRQAIDNLIEAIRLERPNEPGQNLIFEPARSLHDIMRQIAETQVVVATRYHNIVCALKLGRPSISIGYAVKNDVLMADMGLGDYCQHIENLDVEKLHRQFAHLIVNRTTCTAKMAKVNDAYRQLLTLQGRVLLERVLP